MRIRKFCDEKPKEGQRVLAKNKHCWIECTYEGNNNNEFYIYMWQELTFWAHEWIPIEEFQLAIGEAKK